MIPGVPTPPKLPTDWLTVSAVVLIEESGRIMRFPLSREARTKRVRIPGERDPAPSLRIDVVDGRAYLEVP